MGEFNIEALVENMNVFDRKKPKAVIRTAKHRQVNASEDFLMHYGISGMKWGVRRFQNADGSLTAAGKERYGSNSSEVKKLSERTEKHKADRQILKDLKSFDKMSDEEKKDIGDKAMDSMRDYLKVRDTPDYDPDNEKNFKDMEVWLSLQVSHKSGDDTGWPVTKANEEARNKYYETLDKANDRKEEIKKEIDFEQIPYSPNMPRRRFEKMRAEYKRLDEAARKDKLWSELNKNWNKSKSNWAGVVLKDIGLRDTPENRSLIWPYVIELWDDDISL